MRASDIGKQLPRVLQRRFESLGGYVRVLVAEERERRGPGAKEIPRERLEIIQLVALAYSLDTFLRAGTHAARQAALTFASKNLKGFAVGSELFTPDNETTMRGQRLADALRGVLEGTRYARLVAEAGSMTALIGTLVREALRDE